MRARARLVCLAEEARSQLRVLCFRIQFVVIATPPARQRSFIRPWPLVFGRVCFTQPPPSSASASKRFYFLFRKRRGDTRPASTASLSRLSIRTSDRCTRQPKHATCLSRGPRDFDVRKRTNCGFVDLPWRKRSKVSPLGNWNSELKRNGCPWVLPKGCFKAHVEWIERSVKKDIAREERRLTLELLISTYVSMMIYVYNGYTKYLNIDLFTNYIFLLDSIHFILIVSTFYSSYEILRSLILLLYINTLIDTPKSHVSLRMSREYFYYSKNIMAN